MPVGLVVQLSTMNNKLIWGETKRQVDLEKHGLDFAKIPDLKAQTAFSPIAKAIGLKSRYFDDDTTSLLFLSFRMPS